MPPTRDVQLLRADGQVGADAEEHGSGGGLRKLLMVIKGGEALEQRTQDYDAALKAVNGCKEDKAKSLPGLVMEAVK
jgi:hypothetical protein